MSTSAERWRIADSVAHEAFGDSAVLLNLSSGVYYRANAVAARAWEALRAPIDLEGLTDQLLPEFDVDRNVLAADLRALLTDLERLDLVVRDHE